MTYQLRSACLLALTIGLAGCTDTPSPVEISPKQDVQKVDERSPLEIKASGAGFDSVVAYKRHLLTKAEQKRKSLERKMDDMAPVVETFQRAFSDNQSIAVSVEDLSLSFAGKSWVGTGDTKQMSIKIRLENPAQRETIRSIVFDMEVYRSDSDTPISQSSLWMVSSTLGLAPTEAAVRPLVPLSDNPFNHPDIRQTNDRNIHLVVRPREIRYAGKTVALSPQKPTTLISKLQERHDSITQRIDDLEHHLADVKSISATKASHQTASLPSSG